MALFRRSRAADDKKANGPALPERSGFTPVAEWPEQRMGAPAAPVAVAPASTLFAGVCRYYHDCFAADA
ncbi:MAG TPA: hypothetical protein VFX31_04890, partial [Ktedonobacterales bacterium]|nr:hypothetical protein [Ktedonobacterales bacterium]